MSYPIATISGLGDVEPDPVVKSYQDALTTWKLLAAFGFGLALYEYYRKPARRR